MESNKKFWFFIKSHIYVNIKSNAVLLYDTHTGKDLYIESDSAIQMANKIYEYENLGSIELEQSDLRKSGTLDFVNMVVKNDMGELQDQNQFPTKPVILLPILSLNFDVERFKDKENVDLFLARDISKYLLDVNVILNSSCQQQCEHCHDYCKQFFCCSKNNPSETLSRDSVINLLRQTSFFPVRTINITGGNIYQYQDLDVFEISNGDGAKIFNFYIHYLNYHENSFIDKHNIHLIVNTPVNLNKLNEICILTKEKKVKFHLIIEENKHFVELEYAMKKLGIEDFEVHPYYNGHNLPFFEENVYLTKEDILVNPISMREIYRNQKLNANSFGSLFFLSNGEIKANLNERVIGNIYKDRIIDVIYTEMTQNTAWRKTRSEKPCKGCVYEHLCPPLSNYERVIKKPNLCHIQK